MAKARSFDEMPATFEYKGHTYHKTEYSDGYYKLATREPNFKYYYGPNDDRMFLWVDGNLQPEEDLFNYDQFLSSEKTVPVPDDRQVFEYKTRFGTTERVMLDVRTYADNKDLCIKMVCDDGGYWVPYTNVTNNVSSFGLTQDGNVKAFGIEYPATLDLEFNGHELEDFLVENDIARPVGLAIEVESEYVGNMLTYPIFEFNEEALRACDPKGLEEHQALRGILLPEKEEDSLAILVANADKAMADKEPQEGREKDRSEPQQTSL